MTFSIPNLHDYKRLQESFWYNRPISCEYRRWDEKSMEEAVSAIEKGMAVRHAAEMYGSHDQSFMMTFQVE